MIDDGSTDRTAEVARAARRRPRRPADQQQGPRRRVPGRHRRGAEAGRRRDRQHSTPTTSTRAEDIPTLVAPILDGRADMVVGDRRSSRSSTSRRRKKAAPAARQLGRAPRLRHRRPRHDLGLSRLQPRGGAAAARRLQLHLHAREPDPGREDAGRGRARPGRAPTRRPASRACSTRPAATCAATRWRSSAPTSSTSRCGCSRSRPRSSLVGALAAWMPFAARLSILNGDSTGHVQSLILGAVLALVAVQMFGLGIIGDALAGQRVIAQRVFERVRRLELAGRGRALAPGAGPGGRARCAHAQGRAVRGRVEDELAVDEELAGRRDAQRGAGRDQVVEVGAEVQAEEDRRTRARGRRPR